MTVLKHFGRCERGLLWDRANYVGNDKFRKRFLKVLTGQPYAKRMPSMYSLGPHGWPCLIGSLLRDGSIERTTDKCESFVLTKDFEIAGDDTKRLADIEKIESLKS